MKERIKEIACRYAPEYPNVENCEPLEQLWAIESTLKGQELALADWVKWSKYLQSRLDWDDDQYHEEMDTFFKGK